MKMLKPNDVQILGNMSIRFITFYFLGKFFECNGYNNVMVSETNKNPANQ